MREKGDSMNYLRDLAFEYISCKMNISEYEIRESYNSGNLDSIAYVNYVIKWNLRY